jgi:hypothetical protein
MKSTNSAVVGKRHKRLGMLIICLVLILAFGSGCSSQQQNPAPTQTETENPSQSVDGTYENSENNDAYIAQTEPDNPTQTAAITEIDLANVGDGDYQAEAENNTQSSTGEADANPTNTNSTIPNPTGNDVVGNQTEPEDTDQATDRTVIDPEGNEVEDYQLVALEAVMEAVMDDIRDSREVLANRLNRPDLLLSPSGETNADASLNQELLQPGEIGLFTGAVPASGVFTDAEWTQIIADIESGKLQPIGRINDDGTLELYNLQERFTQERAASLETTVYIGDERIAEGFFTNH